MRGPTEEEPKLFSYITSWLSYQGATASFNINQNILRKTQIYKPFCWIPPLGSNFDSNIILKVFSCKGWVYKMLTGLQCCFNGELC